MKWMSFSLIMTGVMIAASVYAQDPGDDPWGFSVGVGATYTDNRDGTEGSKKSNLDMSGDVRGDLRWRDGERTILNLFLAPSVKWHSNPRSTSEGNPQNDEELYGALGFDLKHMATQRFQVDLSDTLTYTDDPDITVGGASVRQNANHWLNSARLGLGAEVMPKVGVSVAGQSILKRYDDEAVADEQDEDILKGDAYLKYLMGSGVRVFGMVGVEDFSSESLTRDRGSKVMTYALGAEKVFSPDFTGKVAGGYQTADYSEESLDSLDSSYGAAEVTLRASSPTRIRMGAMYGFFAPSVRPYAVQKLTSGWGAVEHDVTGRFTAALKGQFSDGEYEDEGADTPGGDEQLVVASLRGTFRMDRVWSLNGGYTYETWDSDVRESFDRNSIDLGVRASF